MRISSYVYAGQHERFAEGIKLPPRGQTVPVTMPDGTKREGTVVSVRRVDDERLEITIDIEG